MNLGKKITVCLLTYNHATIIESTLKSILSQTVDDFELIVSDDCSTDGTWDIILKLSEKYNKIRAIQTPHNMGMANNANFAVKLSNRPYIALLHHDDIYREDLLEKWVNIIEKYPDIGFVFNPYDEPNAEHNFPPPFGQERMEGKWFLEKILFPNWGCAVRGTAMIRKIYWDKIGGMRTQFNMLADIDLWMRLSQISAVGYVKEPLITVRAERPDYYPDIYTGKKWHWERKIYLYEIHALNRKEYLKLNTVKGQIQWFIFRFRLSIETIKWLIYGALRKKQDIIKNSIDSITEYDLFILRFIRFTLQTYYSKLK